MVDREAESPAFVRLGTGNPPSPVVLAVPHAGRVYPGALLAASRLPQPVLEQLADRDADRLVGRAVADGAVAIVATQARAWIDLNRHPRELEAPALTPRPARDALLSTAKSRGGLGVIPTRVAGHGEIRRQPLATAEFETRIAQAHEPYHQAITAALATARAAHGRAILLDIHSMPSLDVQPPVHLVVGDLGGRAAARSITERAFRFARTRWATALNQPYAGGYTLERHGRPHRNVHALQIEFDRALYVDPAGRGTARGIETLAAWLARLVAHLDRDEAAIAAE